MARVDFRRRQSSSDPDIADHAELRGNHENEDNSLPW